MIGGVFHAAFRFFLDDVEAVRADQLLFMRAGGVAVLGQARDIAVLLFRCRMRAASDGLPLQGGRFAGVDDIRVFNVRPLGGAGGAWSGRWDWISLFLLIYSRLDELIPPMIGVERR